MYVWIACLLFVGSGSSSVGAFSTRMSVSVSRSGVSRVVRRSGGSERIDRR